MIILKTIFWLLAAFIFYVYAGYPLVLFVLSSLVQTKRDLMYVFQRGERRRREPEFELPNVTLGLSAYNEEGVIEQKLQNCLALDYPSEKLEIIVISDGSDDRTDEIVRRYTSERVKLLADGERHGKPARMNQIVEMARSPIVVLSDANTMYKPDAIKALVRHFSDDEVGAVCGELHLTGPGGEIESESLYWRYEVMLKFMENKLGLVLGSNGGLYAVRKELFTPIPDDTIVDDFVIPMLIRSKGYRIVYDPETMADEQTTGTLHGELVRRRRIAAGNWQAAVMLRPMLNPLNGAIAFSFWSHKIFRWSVPIAMIGLLAVNIALVTVPTYAVLLGMHILFYAAVVAGHFGDPSSLMGRLCKVPHVLVGMNIGLLWGLIRYLRGSQKVTWDRVGRAEIPPQPASTASEAPAEPFLPAASAPSGPIETLEPDDSAPDDTETKELPAEPPHEVDDNPNRW